MEMKPRYKITCMNCSSYEYKSYLLGDCITTSCNNCTDKTPSKLYKKEPFNWFCKCGAGFHEYFITCSCGRENPLDGKGVENIH